MKKTWSVKEFEVVYQSYIYVNEFLKEIGEDVISVTPFHVGDGYVKYVVIYFTVSD